MLISAIEMLVQQQSTTTVCVCISASLHFTEICAHAIVYVCMYIYMQEKE